MELARETQTLAWRRRGAGTPWPTLMIMLLLNINIVVINACELLIIRATTYKVPNKGWALFYVLDVQCCIHSSEN